jgi:hypothetical protein
MIGVEILVERSIVGSSDEYGLLELIKELIYSKDFFWWFGISFLKFLKERNIVYSSIFLYIESR